MNSSSIDKFIQAYKSGLMGKNFDLFDQVLNVVTASDHLDVLFRFQAQIGLEDNVSGITQAELDITIEETLEEYTEAYSILLHAIERES
jgi:hypothetical protein